MDSHTIDQIKQALGIGWEAWVRQQYVIGAMQVVVALLLLIPVAFLGRIARNIWRAPEGETDDDDGWILFGCSIGVCVLTLIAVLLLMDGIGHMVNPIGYAVMGLLPRG